MKKKFKWRKRYIIFGIVLILLITTIRQYIMVRKEERIYEPVGQFVDTGTYKAHYCIKGIGAPLFIFITGSGTPCAYTDFYQLQWDLARRGTTLSFDHAGSGWSEDTKEKRTITNLVSELEQIIAIVSKTKPVILVAHSLGSLEAIAYAQTFPERVNGIIFLDGGSPEFYAKDSETMAYWTNRGIALIRTLGINRILGDCGLNLPMYGQNLRNNKLPGQVEELDQAMYNRYAGNSSNLATIRKMTENAKEICNGSRLGDIPILVLSSDSGEEWNKVQLQLAKWSTRSTQYTIKGAKHYLHWSNYKEVSMYMNKFLDELKKYT